MEPLNETRATIQGRLKVLRKSIVSERNSVQYYQTLLEKTPEDNEENLGERKMYQDLLNEEEKHVETIQQMIDHWEARLKEFA